MMPSSMYKVVNEKCSLTKYKDYLCNKGNQSDVFYLASCKSSIH